MINVAFRLDDPSKTSNHQLESKIIGLLEQYKIPATFAVIPFKDDPKSSSNSLKKQDIPHLIEASDLNIVEIALHGYSHTNHKQGAINSEFSGRSAKKQNHLLESGRSLLENIFERPVIGFVPPWNTYDDITVNCLIEQHFQYLSADWNNTGTNQDIALIPHTCNLPHLKIAVEEARILKNSPSIINVIMHHYDFKEQNADKGLIDLNDFSELLAWVTKQCDINTATLSEIGKMFSPSELQKPIRSHEQYKNLHWRINRLMPQYCLFPNQGWPYQFVLSRLR